MDDQQRRDTGMAERRKVLGDAWVDKSVASINSFNADFVDLGAHLAQGLRGFDDLRHVGRDDQVEAVLGGKFGQFIADAGGGACDDGEGFQVFGH